MFVYSPRHIRWIRRVHRLALGTALVLWVGLVVSMLYLFSIDMRDPLPLLYLFLASLIAPFIVAVTLESMLKHWVAIYFRRRERATTQ